MATETSSIMPTKGKLMEGVKGLGFGTMGGLIAQIAAKYTGSGVIGQVITGVAAIAFLPEKFGVPLATVIGYGIGTNLPLGSFGSSSSSDTATIR